MPRQLRSWLMFASAAAALAGCHRGASPPTATTKTTGAELGSPSNDDAVMRITTARCEREVACNKVGQGRAYENQPACLERIGKLMDLEAGRDECPQGVDSFAVSNCLLDIQRTPCGGELERQTNLPTCTKAALCLR